MTIHREKYKDSTETKVEVGFLRWSLLALLGWHRADAMR
jgi:hypothetical protein